MQNGKRPDTKSDVHTMKMADQITDTKKEKMSDMPNVNEYPTGDFVF
jgi:hypothetical protein